MVGKIRAALGVKQGTLTDFIHRGMPVDSISGAKAWVIADSRRAGRRGSKSPVAQRLLRNQQIDAAAHQDILGDAPKVAPVSPKVPADAKVPRSRNEPLDTLESLRTRVEMQSEIADEAQNNFAMLVRDNKDIPAIKQAGETNNAAQKTLMILESEYTKRLLESGALLTVDAASERYSLVLADLRSFIDAGENEFATLCNPEHPSVALSGYREFKRRFYAKLQVIAHE